MNSSNILSNSARRALLCGTALGASLLIVGAPGAALAADECGVDAPGATTLHCVGPFPAGIDYLNVDDLELVLGPTAAVSSTGLNITGHGLLQVRAANGSTISSTTDSISALGAYSSTGSVDIVADQVTANGDTSLGVFVEASDAIILDINSVTTAGSNSTGVLAQRAATIDATLDFVSTSGELATGIHLEATDLVELRAGSVVTTTGGTADGVFLSADTVIADNITSISTIGDFSRGLVVNANTDARLTVGSVTTAGSLAAGIVFDGHGLELTATTVSTRGDYASAIVVNAAGFSEVNATTITTTGDYSHGIAATVASGIDIDAGSITTGGAESRGIYVESTAADLTNIVWDSVTTTGADSTGVYVHSATNDVTLTGGTVTTGGAGSTGIDVQGRVVSVVADSVTTTGRAAIGILADGDTVTVDLGRGETDGGTVTTSGEVSHGIVTHAEGGLTTIIAEKVQTSGLGAKGIDAYSDAAVTIDVGSVTATGQPSTAGEGSSAEAIRVETTSGQSSITAGNVSTTNARGIRFIGNAEGSTAGVDITVTGQVAGRSTAVSVEAAATSSINVGAIAVAGVNGTGVRASMTGDAAINVNVGSVTSEQTGVAVDTEEGDITATLGTVTGGDHGVGVSLSSLGGDITADVTEVTVNGPHIAVGSHTERGDVHLTVGRATSGGTAVSASSLVGEIVVDAGILRTLRREAHGLLIGGGSGPIDIIVDDVTTQGDLADGVHITSGAGPVDLVSGVVNTSGRGARGIFVEVYGSEATGDVPITITSTSVTTRGDREAGGDRQANGIEVRGLDGKVTINSGTISTGAVVDGVTTGHDAVGIFARARQGEIEIRSNSITTLGDRATAIDARSEDGDIDIVSGTITASGRGAYGVRASSETGDIFVRSASITLTADADDEGGLAAAIDAATDDGSITIESTTILVQGDNVAGIRLDAEDGPTNVRSASIRTEGNNSDAISIAALNGDVFVGSGTIVTTGQGSRAIDILVEDQDQAGGAVTVSSQSIDTIGDDATGITIDALDGLVTVESAAIETDGAGAYGMFVSTTGGNIVIRSNSVTTNGANANGLTALSNTGAIGLTIGSVTANGPNSLGVRATTGGAVTATFTGAVSSDLAQAVELSGSTVTATVQANAAILGGTGGIRIASTGGSTLTNNGRIDSDGGYAIDASGGPATINNAGNLRGMVRTGAAGDTLFNTNTWTTAGTSDFGAGTDQVVNHGVIELAAGTAAQTITFTGLEQIDNQGRIDLANGRAGDRLVATGAVLNGLGTGVIDLDVDFTTGASDQLVIASATGVTRLGVTGIGAIDLTDSFDLIDSTAALTGSEFILTPATETALVGFDLVYEADGLVRLAAAPTVTAFAPLKTAAAGQRAWTKTAEVWSSRMQLIRDIEDLGGEPEKVRVWAQAYGGEEQFGQKSVYDLANGPVTRDLTTETQWFGFQTGIDGVISTEPASFAWGLTSGYGDVRLDFISHDNLVTLTGYNLGAYGGVSTGLFYANALVKLDRFSARAELNEMETSVDFDGTALGVQGETGLRFKSDNWMVEPQAAVAWVKTDLDGFEVAGSEIAFDDAVSLEGRVGVRVSTGVTVGGLKLRTFAGGYAVKEFEGENEMTFTNGGTAVTIKDKPAGSYGRIEFGVATQVAPGVHGFIRGEANLGDNASGFTGRFGASWSW